MQGLVSLLQFYLFNRVYLILNQINPRRIVPLKFTPDDYCLLGYVLGPIVCYITFFICGVYFLALDNRSDKFTQCMETLGTLNQVLSNFI